MIDGNHVSEKPDASFFRVKETVTMKITKLLELTLCNLVELLSFHRNVLPPSSG
jgi:hypothetical protein